MALTDILKGSQTDSSMVIGTKPDMKEEYMVTGGFLGNRLFVPVLSSSQK